MTAARTTEEKQGSSTFHRTLNALVKNPWAHFIELLAAVLHLSLAVIPFLMGDPEPDLRYFANPARTVVARVGVLSDFTVFYKGRPITRNVMSADVAIWNDGNESAKKDEVEAPLVLHLPPGHKVLRAELGKPTRRALQIGPVQHHLGEDSIVVKFDTLKPGDGDVIRLFYEGDSTTPIIVQGAVIGPTQIRSVAARLPLGPVYQTRAQKIHWITVFTWGTSISLLSFACLFRVARVSTIRWLIPSLVPFTEIVPPFVASGGIGAVAGFLITLCIGTPTLPFDFN